MPAVQLTNQDRSPYQKVESLEVNHAQVTKVGSNDDFGLNLVEHAREHDVVFKVRS